MEDRTAVLVLREDYTPGDTFNLWAIGDTHIEAADADEEKLREDVAAIQADPLARVGFMGDGLDGIDYRDTKRFYPHLMKLWAQEAMHDSGLNVDAGIARAAADRLIDILDPIRDRFWWWLHGNHETALIKRHGISVGHMVAVGLGIEERFMGYGGMVAVGWHRRTSSSGTAACSTLFDVHHGWAGPGRSISASSFDENGAKELARSDADVVIRGHAHCRKAAPVSSWRRSRGRMIEWPRWVIGSGTYKSNLLRESWAHHKGFPATVRDQLGPPVLHLTPQATSSRPTAPKVRMQVTS